MDTDKEKGFYIATMLFLLLAFAVVMFKMEHDKVTALKAAVAAADAKTAAAENATAKMQAEKVSAEKEAAKMLAEKKKAQHAASVLAKKLHTARKDVEELKSKFYFVTEENEALKDTLGMAEAEIAILKSQLSLATSESDTLKSGLAAATAEIEAFKKGFAAAKAENETLKTAAIEAEKKIRNLEESLDKMKAAEASKEKLSVAGAKQEPEAASVEKKETPPAAEKNMAVNGYLSSAAGIVQKSEAPRKPSVEKNGTEKSPAESEASKAVSKSLKPPMLSEEGREKEGIARQTPDKNGSLIPLIESQLMLDPGPYDKTNPDAAEGWAKERARQVAEKLGILDKTGREMRIRPEFLDQVRFKLLPDGKGNYNVLVMTKGADGIWNNETMVTMPDKMDFLGDNENVIQQYDEYVYTYYPPNYPSEQAQPPGKDTEIK